jgi:NOL1/NOP2/fmu family ribosome biogenesis protein
MAVVELLDPQPGEKVLDLSAAPGGKSTHLIARMQNQGLLVANETHPRRLWDLAENLERWGARNTAIFNSDPQRLAEHFGGFFDRVLVDAPCSGEGMFRKSQAARSAWSPSLVKSCAQRQVNILERAARLVRPGGVLAYSTCTFAPEENEAVIACFLDAHANGTENAFEIIQARQVDGFTPGKPEWLGSDLLKQLPPPVAAQLTRTVRLFPHHGASEGHFIALLRRTGDAVQARHKPYQPKGPAAAREAFERFCAENLVDELVLALLPELALEGSYLYARPRLLPSPGRLRCVHPGWWLGVLKANRFVPSHALAMGLTADQAVRGLRLPPDDPALAAYLRGESLKSAGEEGWVLVSVQPEGEKSAFPVGWGKRVGGIIKNFYPRGLRWT